MRRGPRTRQLCVLSLAATLLTGCLGGGSGPVDRGDRAREPQRGGELEVLVPGGFDSIDLGQTGNAASTLLLLTAVDRTLYNFRPETGLAPRPDLAVGPPEVSPDKRTVTVRLRRGVRFSPPVNREVVADDVKYGIERLFLKGVLSPNGPVLFGELEGVEEFRSGRASEIAGIRAVDDRTLVFELTQPTAGSFVELSLLLTAPVPKEYAQRFDRRSPSTYGLHQVATGPYMFQADDRGKITREGYRPSISAHLVRNPNWDPSTDHRPAYLDGIRFRFGADNAKVAVRRVIEGRGRAVAGLPPPPETFARLDERARDELFARGRFVGQLALALNTSRPPFNNREARLAALQAIDRALLARLLGGGFYGRAATHFIPPDVTGFAESGGDRGDPGLVPAPDGDPERARELLTRAGAGARRGRIHLGVAQTNIRLGESIQSQLEAVGFEVRLVPFAPENTIFACGHPTKPVEACIHGFVNPSDPMLYFGLTFSSASITPEVSTNFAFLRSPAVDEAIRLGREAVGRQARAEAWAEANRRVLSEAAAVPLVWTRRPVAHSRDVRGPALNDLHYAYVSVR